MGNFIFYLLKEDIKSLINLFIFIRGKWSDGLARNNEAKTGADITATGNILFFLILKNNISCIIR